MVASGGPSYLGFLLLNPASPSWRRQVSQPRSPFSKAHSAGNRPRITHTSAKPRSGMRASMASSSTSADRRSGSLPVITTCTAWQLRIISVEIVCVDGRAALDAVQAFGPDRQYTVLVLQYAFDQQERLADDGQPFAIEQVGPHDDVGDAGLVLEREEHEAFRRSRPL